MMIFILIIFTHSLSDRKIKLIMSGRQYQQSQWNLIKQNNICHLQCDNQIYYYHTRVFELRIPSPGRQKNRYQTNQS
jgi:hypothetical protein